MHTLKYVGSSLTLSALLAPAPTASALAGRPAARPRPVTRWSR